MIGILGGYQTDFARNWTKEGGDFAAMFGEVVAGTLAAAQIDAADIEVIHVGNAFGQLFTGQGHLGAMPATVEPELAGKPASRHESACASGGVALLAAMADLESGRYDVALVLGAELERTVPGDMAADHMAAAAWVGRDALGAKYVWPSSFSTLADEYDRRYGLDDAHLRAIGELNLTNARRNPLAQTRRWSFTGESFGADDVANPPVEGRLRRNDCSQVTDGAAGLVLVSERAGRAAASHILGWGHRTVGLPLAPKLERCGDLVLPHVAATIADAFTRAGVGGVDDVDGIETHDCFTPSEYMAIDHFGITAPGRSWEAVEAGDLEIGGRIPMNPSGGLIGVGHPVGASGVRMVLDAHRQVTGAAGDYQVPGARRFATLNIGGSTATTVSFVVASAG
ncbi:MAG: acetyl-CoA acetyltransferase [Candidatus Nanopelagicales bacterium]